MIDSYVLICPTCGSRIFLRVEKGDYLSEYPVRINCGKCKTLIKGVYRENGGLFLSNATFKKESVDEFNEINAEFAIEISGELPSRKIKPYHKEIENFTSPFLRAASKMQECDLENYISRVSVFSDEYKKWDTRISTGFQLYQDGSIEYIDKALFNQNGSTKQTIETIYDLRNIINNQLKYIFDPIVQNFMLEDINKRLKSLPKEKVCEYIEMYKKEFDFVSSISKLIDIFVDFMGIYPCILPAEAYKQFDNKVIDDYTGISTCTFSDLKDFFQSSYETILSNIEPIICMDNIDNRNNYDSFDELFSFEYRGEITKITSLEDFRKKQKFSNGKKLEAMIRCRKSEPYFQGWICLPEYSQKLRNAMAHNNYKYDGITQIITFMDLDKIARKVDLIEVAYDCIKMMMSASSLLEVILYLFTVDDNLAT